MIPYKSSIAGKVMLYSPPEFKKESSLIEINPLPILIFYLSIKQYTKTKAREFVANMKNNNEGLKDQYHLIFMETTDDSRVELLSLGNVGANNKSIPVNHKGISVNSPSPLDGL